MRIMMTELSHQDPFNPLSNQDFLSQLAQLQTLEATAQLSEGIADLLRFQELSAAGNLIGLTVSATNAEGEAIVGPVERIVLRGNDVLLVVNGIEVKLSQIKEVWREDTAA